MGDAAGAMTRADKALVLLLCILGVGSLFALVTVFIPLSWIAAIHRWRGLGKMPVAPVVEYLARSVSAFYPLCGLCLVLAFDLDRYRPWCGDGGWGSAAVPGVPLGRSARRYAVVHKPMPPRKAA